MKTRPIILQSVRLAPGALASAEPGPVWVQVAREGDYHGHPTGPFVLDAQAFADCIRNLRAHPSFRADANGTGCARVIAVDFHHASEQPPERVAAMGAPAQGWVCDLRTEPTPDGLALLALIDWLEPARSYIREGRYQWMSIAVWPDADHPVSGESVGWYMSSVALTNDPFIQGMVPIAATRGGIGTDDGNPSKTSPRPAARKDTTMNILAKIADRLGIASAVVLAARDDDPKATAALEHEVLKSLERMKLAAQDAGANQDFIESVLNALGTTREEIMSKLVNLLKAASDLEAMKPEYDEMKANADAMEEQNAVQQVAAAMRVHGLPAATQPALLHMRKTDAKGFAEKYPLPPDGAEHTAASIVTSRNGKPTIVHGHLTLGGARGAEIAPTSRLGEAPRHHSTERGLVLFRGTQNEIPLSTFDGRNDVERAKSYLRAQQGSRNFDENTLHIRACELVREARASVN